MSTIIATTLSNGSVSVPTATVVNGSAKAWVNFNGAGTVAIRDSFNVASLTDDGTGQYRVNLTTALGNANFAVSVSAGTVSPGGGSDFNYGTRDGGVARTTSMFALAYFTSGGAAFADTANYDAALNGDLA